MLATSKADLLNELKRRVEDKILEPTNYELLKKLIEKADSLDEAIMMNWEQHIREQVFTSIKDLKSCLIQSNILRKMMIFPLKQIQVKSIISLLLAITIPHC